MKKKLLELIKKARKLFFFVSGKHRHLFIAHNNNLLNNKILIREKEETKHKKVWNPNILQIIIS